MAAAVLLAVPSEAESSGVGVAKKSPHGMILLVLPETIHLPSD